MRSNVLHRCDTETTFALFEVLYLFGMWFITEQPAPV